MLLGTYYAQNYASIIGGSLFALYIHAIVIINSARQLDL